MEANLTNKLTFKYMNVQMAHNLLNCVISAYAAIFLKFNGFTNTEIGIALSAAALISIIIQPAIASFADRTDRLSLRQIVMFIIGLNLVFGTIILLGNDYKSVVFIIYILVASIQLSLTSLSNSLAIEFINEGILINYGLARGLGSLGFSIFSLTLGVIIGKSNPNVLIPIFMILYSFYFFSVYAFRLKPHYKQFSNNIGINHNNKDLQDKKNSKHKEDLQYKEDSEGENALQQKSDKQAPTTTFQFLKTNKKYTMFLLGIMLVFYSHIMLNTYLINIVENVGGNSEHMGIALAIAGFVELPVMAAFVLLLRRFKCSSLVKFSTLFFFVKALITSLAPNLSTVYFAQFLQIFAFSLFTPAVVYYVNIIIPKKDSVKGQSMINIATYGLAGILGNLTAGLIQDTFGISAMLLTGTIATGIGVLIVLASTENTPIASEVSVKTN